MKLITLSHKFSRPLLRLFDFGDFLFHLFNSVVLFSLFNFNEFLDVSLLRSGYEITFAVVIQILDCFLNMLLISFLIINKLYYERP